MRKEKFNAQHLETVLSRHDFIYEKPALKWEQGIPVGNGLQGIMIWGDGNPLNLSVDRQDLWEKPQWEPKYENYNYANFYENWKQGNSDLLDFVPNALERPDTCLFSSEFKENPPKLIPDRCRMQYNLPVGRLQLWPKGKVADVKMRLDLHKATAFVDLTTNLGSISLKIYVSAATQLMAAEYETTGDEDLRITSKLVSAAGEYTEEDYTSSLRYESWIIMGPNKDGPRMIDLLKEKGYKDPVTGTCGDITYRTLTMPDGGGFSLAWANRKEENKGSLLMNIGYDIDDSEKAQREALSALSDPIDLSKVYADHTAWWNEYYKASFLSIPSSVMEGYYYAEVYKMGSSLRENGVLTPLAGPWTNDDGLDIWCFNGYVWNMDTEHTISPLNTCNRMNMALPFFRTVTDNREKLRAHCKRFFGVDGMWTAHLTDHQLNPFYNDENNCTFSCYLWVGYLFWKRYLYNQDLDYLRDEAFPVMKEVLAPILTVLEKQEDGCYHLPCSISPEYSGKVTSQQMAFSGKDDGEHDNTHRRSGPDSVMDLAFIRAVCTALIEACSILKIEDENLPLWQEVLENLAPYPIDRIGGIAVRRDLELESSHRHHSHMMPVYPIHELTMENAPDLIRRTLQQIEFFGRGEWMGFSVVWFAALAAAADYPVLARTTFEDFITRYNTESCEQMAAAYRNSDMCLTMNHGQHLNGNFFGMSVLQEFLIQSWGGELKLFDTFTDAWEEGSFWNMRAEGAFLVSAVREECRTKYISVFCEHGGKLKIKTKFDSDTLTVEHNGVRTKVATDGIHAEFDTKKDDFIRIWAGEADDNIEITPVALYDAPNYFGVKRRSRW